jgi:ubiquinol-cytochrome c reductase cytochrome c subunit
VATREGRRGHRGVAAGAIRWAPALLFPLAGVLVLLLQGPGAAVSASAGATTPADARRIFQRDCAVCHGGDARGTDRGPSLAHEGAASLDYWISTGRMPLPSPDAAPERQTPKYPRATIDALIRYVQSIDGGGGPAIPHVDVATANQAAGGELFRLNCAACHSWSGTGGALTARAAPSTHQASTTQIAEAIRTGPGRMPAFGTAAISNHQLSQVVAYTRYLNHPTDRGGLALGHLGPYSEGAVAVIIGLGLLIVATRWLGTRH